MSLGQTLCESLGVEIVIMVNLGPCKVQFENSYVYSYEVQLSFTLLMYLIEQISSKFWNIILIEDIPVGKLASYVTSWLHY